MRFEPMFLPTYRQSFDINTAPVGRGLDIYNPTASLVDLWISRVVVNVAASLHFELQVYSAQGTLATGTGTGVVGGLTGILDKLGKDTPAPNALVVGYTTGPTNGTLLRRNGMWLIGSSLTLDERFYDGWAVGVSPIIVAPGEALNFYSNTIARLRGFVELVERIR